MDIGLMQQYQIVGILDKSLVFKNRNIGGKSRNGRC